MAIKLRRLSSEPVLKPEADHDWEAGAVFNCAAIYDRGFVHLIYRATDISSNGEDGKYINNLGYAASTDGIHFNRMEVPILINDVQQELRGPEDPRIVKINDRFFMVYTGYGGRFNKDYRISLAVSENLIEWERLGVMLDEPNKDATLFPEKINGKYVLLHRRPPSIWIALSDDLTGWQDHRIVAEPIEGSSWESKKIGIAGPPFRTKNGWLLIYHGVSQENRYSLGVMLLDLEDPSKVIARQRGPILEPELEWEINGHVPNVVFSCGQAVIDNRVLVYYGGGDTVIGVAEMLLDDIRKI